jgi:hypothetical protein
VGGVGQKGMFGVRQGAERGCEMGQLILSMGPAQGEDCSLCKGLLPLGVRRFKFLLFPLRFFYQML